MEAWNCTPNEEDNCIDIDCGKRPVDAFNEIGWSKENLKRGDELFIPERVRIWAECEFEQMRALRKPRNGGK